MGCTELGLRRRAFHRGLRDAGYVDHDLRLGPDGVYRSAEVHRLWHAFTAGMAYQLDLLHKQLKDQST